MHIETTVHIDYKILDKISAAADKLNISRSKVLSLVLLEMIDDNHKGAPLFSRIVYQDRQPKDNWHPLHVSLRGDMYEKLLDLKKLLKLSGSFIFSLAVARYVDKVVRTVLETKSTDNYMSQYLFFGGFNNNMYTYTIYSAMPGEDELQKHLEKT